MKESDVTQGAPRGGTTRLEAFTDAVLAIVMTLLVLDLIPQGAQSPADLLEDWPSYLSYLAAFLTIGSIWLNHNEQMSRVRQVDPIVLALNLVLLLGVSLLPWPTALISEALKDGDRADQIAAIIVFASVSAVLGAAWWAMDVHLARHPDLLESASDVSWMRTHARSSATALALAAVGVGIAFVLPLASLVIYASGIAAFILFRLFERTSASRPTSDASPD